MSEQTVYKHFIEEMDSVHNLNQIAEDRSEENPDAIKNSAIKKMKEVAKKVAERIKGADPKKVVNDPKLVAEYFQETQRQRLSDATNLFHNNLDDIISKYIPGNKLEDLAGVKQIVDKAKGKDREIIGAYHNVKGLERVVEDYKNGKAAEKGAKLVMEVAFDGAHEAGRKEEEERQRKLGYSDSDRQDAMGALYALTIERGAFDKEALIKYAKVGIDEKVAALKKEYDAKGLDVKDTVRNVLKTLARSKSKKNRQEAMSLVYDAEKGNLSSEEE